MACGKDRIVAPGTTVLGGAATAVTPGRRPTLPAPRGAGRFWRAGAALLWLGATTLAAGALFASGTFAAVLWTASVALAGAGWVARRVGRGVDDDARRARLLGLERAVLERAAQRGGDLVATDVATALGLGVAEADAILTSLADGVRVAVEVDSDGVVHYVFRELSTPTLGPAVRVDVDGLDAEADDAAASAEAEQIRDAARAQVERELSSRHRT